MKDLLVTYGSALMHAIVVHLGYVIISVIIGSALGLLFGVLLSRKPSWATWLIPIVSVFQTIPGLVFMGLLFLVTGMRPITVIIALSIYAMFPVLKNTYTGILGVDRKYVEAAEGCGMSELQRLMKIELPLSVSSIMAGVRMSTIYTVSWAVLASMIGMGGLGDFIYQGVSSNNDTLILLGAIPAAILAIILGKIIDRIQKAITPRELRGEDK